MSTQVIEIDLTKPNVEEFSSTTKRLFWLVIISIGILAPAIIYGVPANKDLLNHFRFALPFYDSLCAGHFYPGWLSESNAGYGDPSFRFYPPALYYLLSLARYITGSWYTGTLLSISLLSLSAALGMYFWARSVLSESCAMWAAILYALAPYHVNQVYQAFLLAEFAGAAVLPFAFGFVERVCRRGRLRDVAGLAATYSLLLLTHLPLAVIGSLALAVYAAARLERESCWRRLRLLSIAALLGTGASSIYWIRMVSELKWIGVNNAVPDNSVDYSQNFLFSTFSPDNLNVWWMNILALMTLLLFVPALGLLIHRARLESRFAKLVPIMVLTLVSILMALPLSRPLWRMLPLLQQVQFPWRWLALFSMGGSLLTAATLPLWFCNRLKWERQLRLVILGSMLISVAFTLAHTVREAEYRNRRQFENDLESVRGTASVNYWVPVWAKPHPREMKSPVETAGRSVVVHEWSPEHRSFDVTAGGEGVARVRTFYYPHWVATSAGRELPTCPDTDGALLISLPADGAAVNLDFREPSRSQLSVALSVFSLLSIAILTLPLRLRGEE
ncbi:MAG TPA: 6-pyruvoyl-tetrahydropterin synthase-related protein [Pyrinomonadaceae bacterium]|nr:6-pyruvoyl-tetrahydropterin synthase-related protein [Pyrinomonadaceae bacterium]